FATRPFVAKGAMPLAGRARAAITATDDSIPLVDDLPVVVRPQIFGEGPAPAAGDRLPAFEADRFGLEETLGVGRGWRQRNLGRLIEPARLDDLAGDRRSQVAAGAAVSQRAALGGVVVADPDADRDVIGERHEPAIVLFVSSAGLAGHELGIVAERPAR